MMTKDKLFSTIWIIQIVGFAKLTYLAAAW